MQSNFDNGVQNVISALKIHFINFVCTLLFFMLAYDCFAQNRKSLQPDSVYKSLHIKIRIGITDNRFIGAWNTVDSFDQMGRLTEQFIFDKYPTVLKYQYVFFYDDSGKLVKKRGDAMNGRGAFKPSWSSPSVSSLITFYNYDSSGQLESTISTDINGKKLTETLYEYKLGKQINYIFDSVGNKSIDSGHFFDSAMNIYKSCYNWVSSIRKNCTIWKNEFDKQGRIKKCSVIEKSYKFSLTYRYKLNGLLSEIETEGGSNPGVERFTYEYWK